MAPDPKHLDVAALVARGSTYTTEDERRTILAAVARCREAGPCAWCPCHWCYGIRCREGGPRPTHPM